MALISHVSHLQDKHAKLEAAISDELAHPSPDFAVLQTLKKQKLILKEELERLRLLALTRLDAA